MNVLSLFDGIACGKVALDRNNIKYNNYFSSEIDQFALAVSKYNHKDIIELGDIKNINSDDLPEIDLMMGGSPCQDLSSAAINEGLNGKRSSLLYEFVKLKRKLKPKWFLLENVKPRKGEWKDEIDNLLGVNGIKINSLHFVPQNRERYYWTNIPISPIPKMPEWNFPCWYRNFDEIRHKKYSPTLCTATGKTIPYKDINMISRFTPNDYEFLQSLPINYTKYGLFKNDDIRELSPTRRYMLVANGWTVDVIRHILKSIL